VLGTLEDGGLRVKCESECRPAYGRCGYSGTGNIASNATDTSFVDIYLQGTNEE